MTIPAMISLVTFGVRDVAASTRFYQSLGLALSPGSVTGEVSFFRTAGALFAVYGEHDLAVDAAVAPRPTAGFRGVTVSINVESVASVDAALAAAQAVGAWIPKPAAPADWGGYSGYFADPDGHLWEVAHNPFWPLGSDGLPRLP